MSYRQIADATKLSARVVEGLETGRFSMMPPGIYRRAIVKSVATEVGLDPDQLLNEFVAAFPAELPSPNPPREIEAAAPASPERSRALAMLGVALPLIGALAYLSWPSRSSSVDVTPLPSRPLIARSSEVLPVGGFADAAVAEPASITVTLTIATRCRLRVASDRRELLSRWVNPGETFEVELGEEIALAGDNAAAVQFSINGRPGRQLGQRGAALAVRIGRDDYESFLSRY